MHKLTKHLGFIVLLTLLGVIYIANSHHGERKQRKINELKKEVEDAKSAYQSVKSDMLYKSTESQLAKRLEDKGLKKNDDVLMLIDSNQ